jgi:hypothetical protein
MSCSSLVTTDLRIDTTPPTQSRDRQHVISLSTKWIEGRAMSSSLVTTDLRIDAPPQPKVEIDSMSSHFLRSELREERWVPRSSPLTSESTPPLNPKSRSTACHLTFYKVNWGKSDKFLALHHRPQNRRPPQPNVVIDSMQPKNEKRSRISSSQRHLTLVLSIRFGHEPTNR